MTRKQRIVYYAALIVIAPIFWLVRLTPLNLRDPEFFMQLIILSGLLIFPFLGKALFKRSSSSKRDGQVFTSKHSFWQWFRQELWDRTKLVLIPLVLIAVYIVLNLTSASFFRSRDYAALINKETGNFSQDISEIEFTDIPTVDHATAQHLGNKKMGEIADLVSQFDVAPDYVQINFQNRPVRVTPLRYDDLIKWFNNRKDGLPRLVRVDMIDSSVQLQLINGGMKYSDSEPLFRNIRRHLRLKYPFAIMGKPILEIDEQAEPYWVTPVLKPQVGWFGGLDVEEVILCHAVTGECSKYAVKDVPVWVDRVYPSNMVITQLNDNGRYQQGFINAYIGQKGVLKTTSGYNYLALNDDVFLYTGITSVAGDSSNLGFILCNMRTKETKYYPIASADEESARNSAQGAVQEKNYVATFPILLNIGGRPTYCMALKDQAELVKMYALVDAQNYQTTGTGTSIREAIKNYEISQTARLRNDPEATEEKQAATLRSVISDIRSLVIDGNTYYYMILENKPELVFSASALTSAQIPFLQPGDEIEVTFLETPGIEITEINQISVIKQHADKTRGN